MSPLVPHAFPDYVANILPIGLDLYAPIREPFASLLAAPGPLFAFVLVVCALRLARDDPGEPLVAIPALAGLGALAAYLVQGKGWLYQAYPALAFFALAAGAALARAPQPRPRVALGALAFLAAGLGLIALGRWPLPLAFVAAGIGAALAWGLEGRKGAAPIAEMGVAAALGAACGLFAMDGIETPAIARALASLGPHPTVASLSESLAFGHPMVRRVGGVWVKAFPACGSPPRRAGASTKTPATRRSPSACASISTPTATGWSPTSTATAPTRCWSAGSTPASTNGCGTTLRSRRRGPTIASMRSKPIPAFPPNCGSAPTCSGCARRSPTARLASHDALAT